MSWTIDDPSAHMQTDIYTGDHSASTLALTFDGNSDLQPDLTWTKIRHDATGSHCLYDSTRGATKELNSDDSSVEATVAQGIVSFDSDGYTIGTGSGTYMNSNDKLYLTYAWKANGGSRTTFTESGSNPGGGYQENTAAGFSIVDFVGTGSAGNVTHGLGAVPHVVVVKNRDQDGNWAIYHHDNTSAPETDYLEWNENSATTDSNTRWNDTAPTSTVFTVGTEHDSGGADAENYIAYVWTGIEGYSKFGSYKGNGADDGPFIYTGFKPAWVCRHTTAGGENWPINNSTVSPFNVINESQSTNSTSARAVGDTHRIDFLSNGFKVRTSDDQTNKNGDVHIYMAFAEQPLVTSGKVPCTAR